MGTDYSPFRRSYTRPNGSPATRSCQSELSPMRSLRSTPQSPSVQTQARGKNSTLVQTLVEQ